MIDEQRGDFDGSTRSVLRSLFLITTPISRSRGGVFLQARYAPTPAGAIFLATDGDC
jgi:hypothetical protein